MNPINQQQPDQSFQGQQSTFSPAPTVQPPTEFQHTNNSARGSWFENHRTVLVILVVLSLFIVPGVTTIPAVIFIVYLALSGGKTVYDSKTGLPRQRSTAERVFRGIGWVLLICLALLGGFIALIFILFASGGFKIG